MTICEQADELIESTINGNTSTVVQTLNGLPQRQALAVVAYMTHYFPGGHDDLMRFLRAIERNAD
jgi:hypothetical protein